MYAISAKAKDIRSVVVDLNTTRSVLAEMNTSMPDTIQRKRKPLKELGRSQSPAAFCSCKFCNADASSQKHNLHPDCVLCRALQPEHSRQQEAH